MSRSVSRVCSAPTVDLTHDDAERLHTLAVAALIEHDPSSQRTTPVADLVAAAACAAPALTLVRS